MNVQMKPLTDLHEDPANAREHGMRNLETIAQSLKQFGQVEPLVVRKGTGTIVGGNGRLKTMRAMGWKEAAVVEVDLTDAQAVALALALNRSAELAEWNIEALGRAVDLIKGEINLESLGWSDVELNTILASDYGGGPSEPGKVTTLAERFGVPPFSVLDSRQGYWQDRKRAWLGIGINSEVGRGGNLLRLSDTLREPDAEKRARLKQGDLIGEYQGGNAWGKSGTSIFDPVLCELAVRWLSPPGGTVLDPFAGGSVRGVVTGALGRNYLGVDLRAEQVKANEEQADAIFKTTAKPRKAEATISDPGELTPVAWLEKPGVWVKREDLFEVNGAFGAKVRAALIIGKKSKGLSVAGSRTSPMVSRVARVAEALKIPCRCHLAPSKELSDQEKDAQAHGGQLVKHKVGYLTALVSKARKDAKERGWGMIELGVESPEYCEVNSGQVANIPKEAKRVVVSVGSGMGLASVLLGLKAAGRADLPVLGVSVGFNPRKLLDRWEKGWAKRVKIVTTGLKYEERAKETSIGGIELDPYYEAKCIPFLKPGDCLYVLARRTIDRTEEAEPVAPWQRGIPLERLKEVTALFKAHDQGLILGGFTRVGDDTVAEAWAKGELHLLRRDGKVVGAILGKRLTGALECESFNGATWKIPVGHFHAHRIAYLAGQGGVVRAQLEALAPVAATVFQEHPEDRAVVGGWGLQAMKIKASSEYMGTYAHKDPPAPWPAADLCTLTRLGIAALNVGPLARAIQKAGVTWADHYSTYNKGKSWSAVALRGYGGRVDFIEKPAEMPKAWKRENPEKLKWAIEDTPLREALPEAEKLIGAIPGTKHRIRLMRLAPGGGELTRHADITDPDGGTEPGKTLRIHIPIVTNPGVLFTMWQADGSRIEQSMGEREAWYLDTRKAHKAINGGETERIHLVMDVESNPELLALLKHEGTVVADVAPFALAESEVREVFAEPLPQGTVKPVEGPGLGLDMSQAVKPRWIVGDSGRLKRLTREPVDLVFSCPPYADLERYSEDPADLSTMGFQDFLKAYRGIIAQAVELLKPDRFACFVVGEVRDQKTGHYRGLIPETIRAFEEAGARFYNEAILVTSVGSLPLRAAKAFETSRKLGKTHQNFLVFVKGDPRKAAEAIGTVDFGLGEPEEGEGEPEQEPEA